LEFAQEEDTLGAEAVVAVRQQGREYTEAVTRYSNAAMAWLAFMETIKDARKGPGDGSLCPCAAQASLPAMGAIRYRRRYLLYVSGDFRH
jgi:hypothetical protein